MSIKQRFLISYIGGILIASLSIIAILCIIFYVTTGSVPTPKTLYQTFTKQRSLSPEEEGAYIDLRKIAKENPEALLQSNTQKQLQRFEKEDVGIVISREDKIIYYSKGLVEKSLVVHFPKFDQNNIETKGTIDNSGNLYRYIKFDFYYSDQEKGSVLVLKKENSFLEFLTKWGIVIIGLITLIAVIFVWLLNRILQKTIVQPLANLGETMTEMRDGHLVSAPPPLPKDTAIEVQRLQRSFEQMREALNHSLEEQRNLEKNRKDLIASISHDLKTPITSIIGYVQGLQEGIAETPEKQQSYLQTIYTKSVALNDLIEQLFLYSKYDAEAIPFHLERVELSSFLQHIIEEFQWSHADVHCQFESLKMYEIQIDRLQMNRALVNLLENSAKFKKVDVPIYIEISLREKEHEVGIVIRDNGRGIPKEQLPHVFQHFYRGEKARTSTGGSGLGLAIVQQIIEKHHGAVEIDSDGNNYTEVIIWLPYEEGENEA